MGRDRADAAQRAARGRRRRHADEQDPDHRRRPHRGAEQGLSRLGRNRRSDPRGGWEGGARDPAAGPANLHLAVARQATYANGVLGDGLELEGAAWSFSVMVRVQPGQSLGASIDVGTNLVTAIGESGAIPNVNQSHPRAIQVGDRIVSVDGIRCPSMNSIAELESWFQGRKIYSKGIPRDMRIALLRPVELAADVTVLPPYEYCLVQPPPAALPSAEAGGKEARAPEEEQSAASTVSTTSPRLPDASSGERRP